MKFLVLLGRILFTQQFIYAAYEHFTKDAIAYGKSHGVPFASFFVPLSGILCLLGALSILLGYKAKIGAWLLIIFLVPVTFMMHRFWESIDPGAAMIEKLFFIKNLTQIGTALLIAYFGAGPLSFDNRKVQRVRKS